MPCRTREKNDGDTYVICYGGGSKSKGAKKKPKAKKPKAKKPRPSRAEQAGVLVKVPVGRIDTGGPRMVGKQLAPPSTPKNVRARRAFLAKHKGVARGALVAGNGGAAPAPVMTSMLLARRDLIGSGVDLTPLGDTMLPPAMQWGPGSQVRSSGWGPGF